MSRTYAFFRTFQHWQSQHFNFRIYQEFPGSLRTLRHASGVAWKFFFGGANPQGLPLFSPSISSPFRTRSLSSPTLFSYPPFLSLLLFLSISFPWFPLEVEPLKSSQNVWGVLWAPQRDLEQSTRRKSNSVHYSLIRDLAATIILIIILRINWPHLKQFKQ